MTDEREVIDLAADAEALRELVVCATEALETMVAGIPDRDDDRALSSALIEGGTVAQAVYRVGAQLESALLRIAVAVEESNGPFPARPREVTK